MMNLDTEMHVGVGIHSKCQNREPGEPRMPTTLTRIPYHCTNFGYKFMYYIEKIYYIIKYLKLSKQR